ncbi:glucan biosynthesis protein [Xylella fastidiosa subsp. morus]|uniref:glucan biosynthesis protein n=1 Tax=Xylella fastidiosa TaxID=2371 RepID=UPI00049A5E8E|nr:glucan biosynthesis protein [Xylella fastidiosa]AIC13398.1 glucan biosynthesis protein D [Xylella fastidiosa MUL0034]UIN28888.1 glucan biosynthesis protein [Xylella fastidiosa subsp. morus]UIT36637.1 glucan biosynthesis protein [Xylella fastidiosa subsp. morus]UIT38930.1 glucan biosynthesis protein [Xylella fastidiosa subsp. morus]UIT43371.1 glucan biosynthesis protein [Xylella fastidiosa subsp. morus]
MYRRDFLKSVTAAWVAFGLPNPLGGAFATNRVIALRRLGQSQRFDYEWLKERARALAATPYHSRKRVLPTPLERLSWDQYQSIRYRQDHALWADSDAHFQVKFFHLGLYFHSPVRMYEVVDGMAQELAYDPAAFDYGSSGLNGKGLPKDLGFAGFRLNTRKDIDRDFAAFLGASYFRAVGQEGQYGQSARGLAVNTGSSGPEEFPDFIAYYLEQPTADADTVVMYGLLDSPSIAGAYRFSITHADVLRMDIDSALYPRETIERLGIAPCTSMYQVGENDRRMGWDWRPEIHDTDGLFLWTGNGEWIWRPLCNPLHLRFNMFLDNNPRGFGLLQRDRDFDHYQDDGVFYEKRPCLWVEPKHGWGEGSVQLVEIPTFDETFDNIVAFWNPRNKPHPGQELLFGYRLYWGAFPPVSSSLAYCVATRTGLGGVVGQKRKYFSWRFAVDFVGGKLAALARVHDVSVEPVLHMTRGRPEIVSARPLHEIRGYRVMFDVVPLEDSAQQIDIRLYLRDTNGEPLTETWLYQWVPPILEERKIY